MEGLIATSYHVPHFLHAFSLFFLRGADDFIDFFDLRPELGEEYFADGMTEALITDLAKIGALKVISRTSAMRYKGTIIALGKAESLMPSHLFNGEYSEMLVLRLLMDAIEAEIPGVTFTEKERVGPYLRYTGDFGSGGRGELLLFKPKNTHILEARNNGD